MLRDTSASGEPEDLIEPLNGKDMNTGLASIYFSPSSVIGKQ